MHTSSVHKLGVTILVALALVLLPAAARAQSDRILDPQELTKQPKLASPSAAASLIAQAYPTALRNAGVGGVVELEFVVNATGKVEKNSVAVVTASAPALGEAAKNIAERLYFKPGEVNGTPVRARVVLPLTFKAN